LILISLKTPPKLRDIIAIETLLKSFCKLCAYIDLAKALGWPEDDIPDEMILKKTFKKVPCRNYF